MSYFSTSNYRLVEMSINDDQSRKLKARASTDANSRTGSVRDSGVDGGSGSGADIDGRETINPVLSAAGGLQLN